MPLESPSHLKTSSNQHPIFIAGWDGFIGRHLTATLKKRFPKAQISGCGALDIDLTLENSWESLSDSLDSNTRLLVLAGVKRQAGDALASFEANMKIAVTVARAVEHSRPARLVFFSSAAVYGEETTNIGITEQTSANPTSLYGIAKFASERLLENAARQSGCSLVTLRPSLIYGPGDTTDSYGPVGFCRAHSKARPITLWGDGSELRGFLFVNDCCELVAQLLESPLEGILNLVPNRSHTFRDVLAAVEKASGKKPEISERPRSKSKADHAFDIHRLQSFAPDFRFTTLEEGVRQTLDQEASNA